MAEIVRRRAELVEIRATLNPARDLVEAVSRPCATACPEDRRRSRASRGAAGRAWATSSSRRSSPSPRTGSWRWTPAPPRLRRKH